MTPTRIDLVISDIDGTLVRSDKTLSDAVVAAIGRLRAVGVKCALISARPPSGLMWIAERLRLDGPVGAFNGGTIVTPNGTPEGEIVSAERLEPGIAGDALGLIDQPGIMRWLFHKGRWHADGLDDHYTPRERRSTGQEPDLVTEFTGLVGAVDKIVAVCGDTERLAELESEVAERLGDDANVVRSQPFYLDITAPRANKGDGVAALAAALGVDLARTLVIGDQMNDLAMFARAGLSVAMGNGPEVVKAAASHVTGANDADGVAQAIDDFVLPLVRGIEEG